MTSSANINFYRDWDYFTSSASSLRTYFLQYHTVPTWNVMLCGGKPELANPQSWAFTWPSLFAYGLPGALAPIGIFAVLSVVGFFAMLALLRRMGAGNLGAILGATLYLANGYFASHYNQGHVTFAFFHLVPVLMLVALRIWDSWLEDAIKLRDLVALALVTFAFFTAALPHALFYFYPAFLILLGLLPIVRTGRRPRRQCLKPLALIAAVHGFGIWTAAYKLWPVVDWQQNMPRTGVLAENLGFFDLAGNMLRFLPNYDRMADYYFKSQVWGAWEYNAYVGFGIFFVILLAAGLSLKSRGGKIGLLPAFGLAALIIGTLFALGNANPLSPARVFRYLPFVKGIRVFGRYQILSLFGLSLLLAWAAPILDKALRTRFPQVSKAVSGALLAALACAPGLWQMGVMLAGIQSVDDGTLQETYPSIAAGAAWPALAMQKDVTSGYSHQSYLLRQGYWVANCYEPLTVSRLNFEDNFAMPLTSPQPDALGALYSDGFDLEYSKRMSGVVAVNFVASADFDYNVPMWSGDDGRPRFDLAALPHHVFQMRRAPTVETSGAWLSLAGALALLLFLRRWSKQTSR